MDLDEILEETRYHEAGHAVAAYHHGMTLTDVTVTPDVWITNYKRPSYGGWAEFWRQACITMAGQLAEQRFYWGEIRPESWAEFRERAQDELEAVESDDVEAGGDHAEIMNWLEQMASDRPGDGLEESYQTVVENTQAFVSEHWDEIEAVARGLESSGTLTGEEVVRIIEEASAQH